MFVVCCLLIGVVVVVGVVSVAIFEGVVIIGVIC